VSILKLAAAVAGVGLSTTGLATYAEWLQPAT